MEQYIGQTKSTKLQKAKGKLVPHNLTSGADTHCKDNMQCVDRVEEKGNPYEVNSVSRNLTQPQRNDEGRFQDQRKGDHIHNEKREFCAPEQ